MTHPVVPARQACISSLGLYAAVYTDLLLLLMLMPMVILYVQRVDVFFIVDLLLKYKPLVKEKRLMLQKTDC